MLAGISGDLRVEDEKAILQLGKPRPDAFAMPLQKRTSLGFRARSLLPQGRIIQHLADRHSRRLQAAEKFDPDQDRCVIVALPGPVAIRIGKQPDPLVVADGMGRQAGAFRQFADLHGSLSRHDAFEARTSSALEVKSHYLASDAPQERVAAPLVADAAAGTMSADEADIIAERQNLVAD